MGVEILGGVAAGHQATAEAAAAALRAGGNAFDAALSGILTACVAETVLASLGGGGFLLAYEAATKDTVCYDFFTAAPRQKRPLDKLDFYPIKADFGPATQEFHIGAGSVAVPGMVPGLFAVHEDLCRLPFAQLAAPAIAAARKGVVMTPFQADLFKIVAPILTASPAAAALHAPNGRLLAAGELYRNPAFAALLERLVEEGPELFESGAVGQAVCQQSQSLGGHLGCDDLALYRVERRAPIAFELEDFEIFTNPPPSAGGILVAFGLKLLQQAGLSGEAQALSPLRLAEVMAATNAARAAGDVSLQDRQIARYAKWLRQAQIVTRGTTHISVVDAQGNAAAATVSNGEGNGLIVDDFGFMLNNMLGEEDLNPDGFHNWREGERLSSMMAPTLVQTGGGGVLALGSGGSNRIRSAVLQVLVNYLLRGMSIEEAVEAPRLHLEKDGRLSVEVERGVVGEISAQALADLRQAYPDLQGWAQRNLFFGGVHCVVRQADGRIHGAGDKRRQGVFLQVRA